MIVFLLCSYLFSAFIDAADVVRLVPQEKAFVKAKEEAAKSSDYGLKKNKAVEKTFRGDILQKFRDAFPDDPFEDMDDAD